jgi:hypothetical protein
MVRRSVIGLFAGAVLVGSTAFGGERAPEFARVDVDELGQPRALQMAVSSYAPDNNDRILEVDLVGAIHIGDPAYYAELNRRFADYDAVLYELIAPPDAARADRIDERKGLLSTTQVGLTKLLGLSFQLDEIHYDAVNFVHADLSPAEMRASMAERGESLYVYFWRVFFATLDEYAKDPLGLGNIKMLSSMLATGEDDSFKTMVAYQMTDLDTMQDMLGEDSENAVIGARNQRAIDVLRREIESGAKRIAVFYGVAHMPDMESRLLEQLNLTYAKTEWVDAWLLGDTEVESND